MLTGRPVPQARCNPNRSLIPFEVRDPLASRPTAIGHGELAGGRLCAKMVVAAPLACRLRCRAGHALIRVAYPAAFAGRPETVPVRVREGSLCLTVRVPRGTH
jgi:predicted alpha/beta-hydrolase family hydrolase